MGSLPTDEETLEMYEAPDEYSRAIDERIRSCSIARDLRSHPDFRESRPHLKIPEAVRPHNLTGGTLAGPGMIVVPPYIWNEKEGKELVSIFYVGSNVSGHPGLVHGGLLATMLDEGLARCCFPALPNKVGVTATLQIDYKKPTKAEQYLVLKATTTKVEGRKAFVEGHIETLPEDGEEPEVLVSANALFIEPKHAAVSGKNARGLRVSLIIFFTRCLRVYTKSLDELFPTNLHGKEFVGYGANLRSYQRFASHFAVMVYVRGICLIDRRQAATFPDSYIDEDSSPTSTRWTISVAFPCHNMSLGLQAQGESWHGSLVVA